MSYSVGELAKLSGITVRTLHHYDEIGLLEPSGRTSAGYRRYSDADVDRLRRVLAYRELGFGLDDIADILACGSAREHLERQLEVLLGRAEQYERMAAAVQRELEAYDMGLELTQEEKFELFGAFDPDEHAEEAERRWGGDEPFRQSQRRMNSMSKADWNRFLAAQEEIYSRFGAAFHSGVDASAEQAMDIAEEHRRFLTEWCYDCSYELHRGLGDVYVAEPRFTAFFEGRAPGLARFVRDAIAANAARAAG